jgi:long-chain fatty acid transport protein
MKKARIPLAVIASVVLLSSLTMANGLNLSSLGSRALAMGGAYVGLADDFSAIFWNPAGIAQFTTKYFGFYGTDIIPSGTYELNMDIPGLGTIPVVNAETSTKHYLAGLAAYYIPVTENLVAGIGVYVPAGLGAEWDGADFTAATMGEQYQWASKIGMVTISPALAYKINDMVYVGATLNLNYTTFSIKTHAGDQDLGVDIGQYDESLTGWGYGATLGILVKPSEMFSVGATVRTPSKISFSGDIEISKLNILGMIPGSPLYGADIATTTSAEREVTWPMWLAGGVALKPVENLTLTADIQWTQWSKIDVMKTEYDDPIWSLIVDTERKMYWDDATQIRFGAEYRINTIALRGGYYWDPSPAPDRTMNVLLPNYDFNVITLGFGYALDGLQIDIGLEYLMGKERDIPYAKTLTNPDWKAAQAGVYNMNIMVPNVSISYKF